ncbi:MAG: hypothetical protein J6A25_09500 [Lachnospiraceae bacterium]|nr:hypothetical protein [Lachnospiraceae bacterium]
MPHERNNQDEAVDYVGKVWNRDMGYLFENIEKMDIQEERRKTKEARAELEKTKAELNETEMALAKAQKEIEALKAQLNKKG